MTTKNEAKVMAEQFNAALRSAKETQDIGLYPDYDIMNRYISTINKVRGFLAKHPEYTGLFPDAIIKESDTRKLDFVDMTQFED